MRSATQLVLLVVYFVLVFVVSRMLDLVLWCQHGTVATQAVDPLVLSVRQLKQLLQTRGVSYAGYAEKQDLAHLIQESADLVQGEVDGLTAGEADSTRPQTRFTSSSHLYEQVEDNKDSVWLVRVVPARRRGDPSDADASWRSVSDQMAAFDVRTGVLDCRLDQQLCASNGWLEPTLLLALPRGKSKGEIVMATLTLSRPQPVVDWVHSQLSSHVKTVESLKDVERDWLQPVDNATLKDVRVLLLTHLFSPPLFLAALSIKFTGRVTFGIFTVKKGDSEAVGKRLKLAGQQVPAYLVVTPERKLVYGRRRFEHFNFGSMNLFLRAAQPEMNDVFLCSLVVVNMLVSLQIFQVSVRLWWKHVARCLWTVVSYNCWLFAAWLLILAASQFSFVPLLADKCLVLARYVSLTHFGAILRGDWLNLSQHLYLLFSSFFLYGWAATWLLLARDPDPVSDQLWWEVLPVDSRWINCFFRPMGTVPRPLIASEVELEEGIDMLIERLAVPNLWLQPVIPTEYIKNLPVWKHRGWDRTLSKAQAKRNVKSAVSEEETIERMMDGQDPGVVVCQSCREERLIYRQNRNSPGSRRLACGTKSSDKHSSRCVNGDELSCVSSVEIKQLLECSCDGEMTVSEDSGTDDGGCVPRGMRQTTECAVCLEPYGWGAALCGLPCGHSYHQGCIMVWLQRDNHHCPVCRWPAYKHKHAHNE